MISTRFRLAGPILFLTISVTLTGCGIGSPSRIAAEKIANGLPGIVGPAAHYDVTVDGDSGAIMRGRAKRVRIEGTDVQVSPELTMSHISLDARDLEFNMDSHTLERAGPITFTGLISQENVTDYLSKTRPDVTVVNGYVKMLQI